MSESRYAMRTCPSCLREVPPNWNICFFCGNVFKRPEPMHDEPTILFWNRENLDLDRNTLFLSEQSARRSRELRMHRRPSSEQP